MYSPIWYVKILQKVFPVKLIYRMTNWPVVGRILESIFFRGDDVTCLAKDSVISIDETVADVDSIVLPSRVAEYFIDKACHIVKMDFCFCRQAMKCSAYGSTGYGCLFLGEAASGINPQLGRSVSKEEAIEHLRRCREAGLYHLMGHFRIDTRWLLVGPFSKLLTICNCCPCCCLWKNLPSMSASINSNVKSLPGVKVKVTDRCSGCGTCAGGVCFVNAISIEGDRAAISEACRGCGNCVSVCPEGAIELTIEDNSYMESVASRISTLIDVT